MIKAVRSRTSYRTASLISFPSGSQAMGPTLRGPTLGLQALADKLRLRSGDDGPRVMTNHHPVIFAVLKEIERRRRAGVATGNEIFCHRHPPH